MKVSEYLTTIKNQENYVTNSLFLKSSDNYGCVYKFLEKNIIGAMRREIFIELNSEESEVALLDKTVVSYVEVLPAK